MFNIWDYWAGRYDRLWVQKYSLKPTREYIIKALSKYKNTEGLRVLDLGCGPGELIRDLTREFKNLDVTGLDFSERMIEISKERNPSAKHLLMDASDLNVLDEEYDIIISTHSIPYYKEPGDVFKNLYRILKPDGGHQHPTQTLTDLLTIKTLKGRLNNFTIGLCGDLKFGRTVHSLIKALSRYENIKFVLISPDELRVPEYIREEVLIKKGIDFIEVERLENVIETLDVLYMTRVQKERFFNEADYIRLKDSYIVDNKKMSKAKEDMILMHPLPRVNEIAVEVDNDPRAAYFTQAKCGMYVRMALIMKLLGVE